jgi:hypothetical protein
MGDLFDLPTDNNEEVQSRILHKKSQPLDQLDDVIKGIRRLMLRPAVESTSEEKLAGRKPTRVAGRMQQQQQGDGVDGQLRRTIWAPGRF